MNINNMPPTSMPLQTDTQSLSLSCSTNISNEQKNLIETTLAEYEASNLSANDASEIVSIFSEAGIQPGKELENALKDAGFDAREIGSLAASQNQGNTQSMPPPPAQNLTESGINQSNLLILQAILEKYQDLSNLNSQDQAQLSQELQEAGLLEPGALINTQS